MPFWPFALPNGDTHRAGLGRGDHPSEHSLGARDWAQGTLLRGGEQGQATTTGHKAGDTSTVSSTGSFDVDVSLAHMSCCDATEEGPEKDPPNTHTQTQSKDAPGLWNQPPLATTAPLRWLGR